MSKAQCQLNHSRNLSTSYRRDNYFYDIERSKATAKQIKFYRSLWYMFKDNEIDINTELDKRGIEHCVLQHPTGRVGYSNAIDLMIDILTEYGLYNSKNEKRGKFKNVYYSTVDSGGKVTRCWEKLEYEESEGENDTDV